MDLSSIAQYIELCIGFVLAVRLLVLDLHRVYKYFAVFLLVDIVSVTIWALDRRAKGTPFHFDYRPGWLIESAILWTLTLLTVYALLDAILAHLPGILRLSRRVLNVSFGVAILIGIASAVRDFRSAASAEASFGWLAHAVAAAIVLDRVIDTAALLALISILIFLIWFPVEMSRNLVAFFAGFFIYFALKTCIGLATSLGFTGDAAIIRFANLLNPLVAAAVFAYWTFAITRGGETVPARMRVPTFTTRHEERMMAHLEAMNASLLSAVRKPS